MTSTAPCHATVRRRRLQLPTRLVTGTVDLDHERISRHAARDEHSTTRARHQCLTARAGPHSCTASAAANRQRLAITGQAVLESTAEDDPRKRTALPDLAQPRVDVTWAGLVVMPPRAAPAGRTSSRSACTAHSSPTGSAARHLAQARRSRDPGGVRVSGRSAAGAAAGRRVAGWPRHARWPPEARDHRRAASFPGCTPASSIGRRGPTAERARLARRSSRSPWRALGHGSS